MTEPNNNPLHGVTLEQILTALVAHYEAREKVEKLYVKYARTKREL